VVTGAYAIVVTQVVPLVTYVDVSHGVVTVATSVAVMVDSHVTGRHGSDTGHVVVVRVTTSVVVVVAGGAGSVSVGGGGTGSVSVGVEVSVGATLVSAVDVSGGFSSHPSNSNVEYAAQLAQLPIHSPGPQPVSTPKAAWVAM